MAGSLGAPSIYIYIYVSTFCRFSQRLVVKQRMATVNELRLATREKVETTMISLAGNTDELHADLNLMSWVTTGIWR